MDKKLFLKISQNTFYQALAKIATAFSTIIITVIITRRLEVTGYGDFIKAFSYVTLFYMVADFGFNATTLKLFTTYPQIIKKTIRSLFGLRIAISLVLIIAVIISTLFLPYNLVSGQGFNPSVKIAITIISATILCQGLFLSANSYFQHRLKYDQTFLATLISSLVTVIVVAWLLKISLSIAAVATGVIIGSVFLAASSYLLLSKQIGFFVPTVDFKSWRLFLQKTWPIGLALILNLIYFRVDTLIISIVRPTEEVALYGLAYKIFETTLVAPIFFINALYPALLNVFKENFEKFKKISQTAFWLLLLASTLISIFLASLAEPLIQIIAGFKFLAAVTALQILAAGIPFFYLSALLMWLLVVFEKQKWLLGIYGFGALFNLTSNLLFIPKFGYLAAAVTTGLSEAIILFISFYLVSRSFRENQAAFKDVKIS